jgi:virulence factor
MKQTRIGVVGVGRMGRNHCRVLTTIRSAELVGVLDKDQERADEMVSEYGAMNFNDLEQLIGAVDGLIIATPTESHFSLGKRAIEHGVHVLIEKPLTEDLNQAEELRMLGQEAGVVVQVGHIERFNPAYRELKNLLGPVRTIAIECQRLSAYEGSNTDVDVVFDLMVHDLDLAVDLVGREPDQIAAFGLKAMSGNIDHVVAHLSYEKGPLVTLTSSRVTEEKIRKMNVTALEAYIEADLLDKKVSIKRRTIGEYVNHNFEGVKYRQESVLESIHVPMFEPLFLQAQHFVACIRGEEECLVPAQDGIRAMNLGTIIRNYVYEGIIDVPTVSPEFVSTSAPSLRN